MRFLPDRIAKVKVMIQRTLRRRWVFRGIYAGYVLLLAGIAYRCFLWWSYSVPTTDFSNKVDPYQLYYRELFSRKIMESRRTGSEVNVLLLGASVAEQTGDVLQSKLSAASGLVVRVHNAAVSAHTTQDSLNKLEYLLEQGAEFDRIIIYDAINDVRMNCVAAEDFRDDYSHCAWYASFNRKRKTGIVSARDAMSESVSRLIGLGEPDTSHLAYWSQDSAGAKTVPPTLLTKLLGQLGKLEELEDIMKKIDAIRNLMELTEDPVKYNIDFLKEELAKRLGVSKKVVERIIGLGVDLANGDCLTISSDWDPAAKDGTTQSAKCEFLVCANIDYGVFGGATINEWSVKGFCSYTCSGPGCCCGTSEFWSFSSNGNGGTVGETDGVTITDPEKK